VQETHEGAGESGFAKDVNADAFCTKDFSERTQVAVSADGDIMSVRTLQTAKLGNEYLCTTHFETIDNVDDLHGKAMALFKGSRWLLCLMSNLYENYQSSNLMGRSEKSIPFASFSMTRLA
jgi:hypothetical protein